MCYVVLRAPQQIRVGRRCLREVMILRDDPGQTLGCGFHDYHAPMPARAIRAAPIRASAAVARVRRGALSGQNQRERDEHRV